LLRFSFLEKLKVFINSPHSICKGERWRSSQREDAETSVLDSRGSKTGLTIRPHNLKKEIFRRER